MSTNNVSNFELGFGYWWLLNKAFIEKAFLIIALIGSSLFLLYQVANAGIFFYQWKRESLVFSQFPSWQINNVAYKNQVGVLRDLVVEKPMIISAGEQKSDFVVTIKNSNERWGVSEVLYHIRSGDKILKRGSSTLLPKEEKKVLILGYNGTDSLSSAELVIDSVDWLFMNQKTRPKPVSFEYSNISFVSGQSTQNDLGKFDGRSYVLFSAQNNSPFSVKNVEFNIFLFRNDELVGVNTLFVEEFKDNLPHALSTSWFYPLPSVDKVLIENSFDTFDSANFVPFDGAYRDLLLE